MHSSTGRTTLLAVIFSLAASGVFGQSKDADSTAARLRKIEDRQAIEQLLMGDYPRALDASDWTAYAALFTKDGVLIMDGGKTKVQGPEAIKSYLASRQLSPIPADSPCPPAPGRRNAHVVNNLTLQLDGDTATGQAYWQTIGTRECKAVILGAGYSEDIYKREDGRWKFSQRAIFNQIPPPTKPAPASSSSR